ncbi:MAG: hypothetical protein ACC662_09365 [Planctomycetota bacterium]
MPRPRSVSSPLPALGAAFLVFVLLGALAWAADARPVDLPLASGKSIQGVVESADARDVVVRVAPEEVRRVPWEQLRPLGVYRVKAALAPAADGKARLALAELAIELGLHAEARAEYEKALALGAIDRKKFDKVVLQAERDAVEVGVHHAWKAAESGDFDTALATARRLKLDFGGAPNAAAIDKLVADLLRRIGKLRKETDKASRELERAKLGAPRNKEILTRRTKASGLIQLGRDEAKKAAAARERGNVTRARKQAEAADEAFTKARRHLGRLRRILGRADSHYRAILQQLNDLDIEQFRLLFDTAWFFWEQRIYSKADRWAAKASYIDPVHPDLLALREMLRSVRIRYRLSDITNARPIIR